MIRNPNTLRAFAICQWLVLLFLLAVAFYGLHTGRTGAALVPVFSGFGALLSGLGSWRRADAIERGTLILPPPNPRLIGPVRIFFLVMLLVITGIALVCTVLFFPMLNHPPQVFNPFRFRLMLWGVLAIVWMLAGLFALAVRDVMTFSTAPVAPIPPSAEDEAQTWPPPPQMPPSQ